MTRQLTAAIKFFEPMSYAAYDDQAIWGTGETPETALENAGRFVNAEEAAALREGCRTAVMTPACAAKVESQGGNIAFVLLKNGFIAGSDEQ